jgi:glycosyltransferase involved in cell wall biosynthesis
MATGAQADRVIVDGKHLSLAGTRFSVRGVTYGSFLPRADGEPFPPSERIEQDFGAMAASGFNTVRVYTPPPPDLVELAARHDLRLLVGLHYHDLRSEAGTSRAARRRVRDDAFRAVDEAMSRLAGRPEVLAVSVGNEVPGDLVRLHGRTRVERLLDSIVTRVHDADPTIPVTYTNYPTTEYLEVPGVDVVTFNVFLEDPDAFRRYLRHLQVAAGPRPVVLTELGLAAGVHGDEAQAGALRWQLATVDEEGLAGATVFAWTDEWGVAGAPVEGWGFGLTRDDRSPRPALDVARDWASRPLRELRRHWPRVSVIVCAYNEEATIRSCLDSLDRCDYPDLEVVVCDDGSLDATRQIAREYPFKLLTLAHGGLSRARNAGLDAASGDVVAYLDADAACHPQWPYYLALSLEEPDVVATGGPNLPFDGGPLAERAVALSPGAPTEVLIGDDRAEHVPGCNMAFRADALRGIGGFDPVYTSAGDDVDVCWKLLDGGGAIAFTPAAQVRHHRRNTVAGYLRQQRGYGRAERLLVAEHPHWFNRLGQARWTGFIYGNVGVLPRLLRPVVYHGPMGTAPYQTVTARPAHTVSMWGNVVVPFAIVAALVLGAVGLVWPPTLVASAVVAAGLLAFAATVAASTPLHPREPRPGRLRVLVGALHLLQPVARTWGRLRTPVRPIDRTSATAWTGDREGWLRELVGDLRRRRVTVTAGAPSESWDIACAVGPFVRAKVTTAVAWGWTPRFRISYRPTRLTLALAAVLVATAFVGPAWFPAVAVTIGAVALLDALVLRRRLTSSLATSVTGAGAATSSPSSSGDADGA